MNWSDERYVRVYTRDTPDWLCLSFMAQGLFCLLLRKVNRAGVMPLGKLGRKGVALAIGFVGDWPRIEPALEELLADGCVTIKDDVLVIPNFIEAQEAQASDAARARAYREGHRDKHCSGPSRNVTQPNGNVESRDGSVTKRDGGVTKRDEIVTPSLAVPNQPSPPSNNRLPTKAELLAAKYPATASLIDLLSESGVYLAPPKARGDELEAALVTLGVEDVARGLLRQLEGRDDIGSLGFFQSKLIAAAKRPTKPKTNGHPVTPAADLSWLERLNESQRHLAEQAWTAKKLEVQSTFRPESVPRVLAEAAEVLRQEFLA